MTATYTFRPAWRSSHGGEREHAHVTSLRRQRRNARNWLPASAKGGTYPRRAYFLADELAQVHEPILPLVHVCDGVQQHRGLAPALKQLHGGRHQRDTLSTPLLLCEGAVLWPPLMTEFKPTTRPTGRPCRVRGTKRHEPQQLEAARPLEFIARRNFSSRTPTNGGRAYKSCQGRDFTG